MSSPASAHTAGNEVGASFCLKLALPGLLLPLGCLRACASLCFYRARSLRKTGSGRHALPGLRLLREKGGCKCL